MRIHRLYWLIAVLGGLILAACGDSDEPKPAPSPAETLAVVVPEATAEPSMPMAYLTTPCPVTIANGSMPSGETSATAPVNHGNGEIWITLWTGGKVVFRPDGPGQILASGAMSMPFPWWSTARGSLTIEGRRLDAPSLLPMGPWDKGDVGDDGFFMRTITFPSEGCWEVTGSVDDVSLNFVTLVVREDGEGVAPATTPVAYITTPCPVTIANGSRPPDENSASDINHGNGELWTGIGSDGTFRMVSVNGWRVVNSYWWRNVRGFLAIEGRRLDAPAPPLVSRMTGGNWGSGFEAASIVFPTEGCWEVTGSVGNDSLTFVTLVVRGGTLTPTAQEPNFSDVLLLQQYADGGSTIRQVDTYNGADVPGYVPMVSDSTSFWSVGAFAEVRGIAAVVEYSDAVCSNYGGGGTCMPAAVALQLIDLQAWSKVSRRLPGNGSVERIVFSPDGARVAHSYLRRDSAGLQETSTLMVFEADTGAAVARRALGFRPSLLEYSGDNTELVVYGVAEGPILGISRPAPPRVALLDANTLEVKWERELANVVSGRWCFEKCKESYQDMSFVSWRPAVVLSKDRRRLYIVHADDERITTVDLDTRTARDTEMQLARSWAESLLDLTAGVIEAGPAAKGVVRKAGLSADETRLYVLTRESEGSGGLTVVDIATGQRSARRETEATGVRIVLDGKFLLLDGRVESEFRTEVLGADSLGDVANLAEWQVKTGRDLAGRPIILAKQFKEASTWFAVLDPESFEVGHGWVVDGMAWWLTP